MVSSDSFGVTGLLPSLARFVVAHVFEVGHAQAWARELPNE